MNILHFPKTPILGQSPSHHKHEQQKSTRIQNSNPQLSSALSSFKGEIPHIACKMPLALARANHPRPNIFLKGRYSISSITLVVELFSKAEIRISVQQY
jgi:hypothetical protein